MKTISILLSTVLLLGIIGVGESDAIECKVEHVLIFKILDKSPACVKPSTAEKLMERGWGMMPEEPYSNYSDSCKANPDPGLCKAAFPKYYFNSATSSCEQFIWGGCGGVIPFDSLLSCQVQCEPVVTETNENPTETISESKQKLHDEECSGNARCFTGTVTEVIDGDTIRVDGKSIRFALASAPELHESGGEQAKEFINTLCPVGSIALVDEDDGQTQGSYGRIIGVIYCNDHNLNEELLDAGLGEISFSFCDSSEFWDSPWAFKHGCFEKMPHEQPEPPKEIQNCDASYPDFCIPPPPPDLDCKDIPQKRFTVLQPDPHRFDGDKDGIGCES